MKRKIQNRAYKEFLRDTSSTEIIQSSPKRNMLQERLSDEINQQYFERNDDDELGRNYSNASSFTEGEHNVSNSGSTSTASNEEDILMDAPFNNKQDDFDQFDTIVVALQFFSIKFNLSRAAIRFLVLLINYFCKMNIPKTLCRSKPRTDVIKSNENFAYFGIKNVLKTMSTKFSGHLVGNVVFHFNFDGIPLFKSSRFELWPILVKVITKTKYFVAPVALYFGRGKPEVKSSQNKFHK